jgi:hypothetical protein
LGPLQRASLNHWKLALSAGLNRVGVSPPSHLRTETDPVSETLCFLLSRIPGNGQNPKPNISEKNVLSVPGIEVSYLGSELNNIQINITETDF